MNTYITQQGEKLLTETITSTKSKLSIECKFCHNEYKITWKDYRRNHRCNKCFGTPKHAIEYIKTFIESFGDYLLSESYENVMSILEIKCGLCNDIYKKSFNAYQSNHRCKKCAFKNAAEKCRLSQEYVENYISSFGDKLLENYINHQIKLAILCGECNNNFSMSFNNYSRGKRCTCNTKSKGESAIKKYLENNNIEFIEQQTFNKCKNINKLPFDFYIKSFNLLIEYDGIQHLKIVKYFGGLKKFHECQHRDIIKNLFCLENNINLLRIPYTDFYNITNILDNIFKCGAIIRQINFSNIDQYSDQIITTYEKLIENFRNSNVNI